MKRYLYLSSCVLILLALSLAGTGCGAPPPPGGTPSNASPTGANAPSLAGAEPPATTADSSSFAAAPGETPVDGDWIIDHLPAEPGHLNPLLDTGDAYSARVVGPIFESLLERDNETLELKPLLAESYEVSEDHLTYTFKMRKDATFSDGVSVTAKDVMFTFDAIRNPANETADLRNYFQDVEHAELLDDYTIRFTCNKPYFKHLDMLGGLPAFPEHIYGQGDFNTHPNNRKPVGSGPYLFESWDTGQQITLARNDNYWRRSKLPHIKKQVFKIILSEESAFQVLEKQELDVMSMMPEQWVHRAVGPAFDAKFNRYSYWAPPGYVGNYIYIGWNMRKPQFSDPLVRRAMTMLLNREEILATIFYGLGKVTSGPEVWNTPEYNTNIQPWPFDPEGAKKLLDEAGWIDHDQDGIRDKDGVKFAFEFMYPTGRVEYEQLATVYKEQLDRVGIQMEIRRLEWATFIEKITQRSFDAVILAWALPVDSDPYQVWHSSQAEHGSNYPGFKNAEVDQLLENARVEFDRQKRIKLYWRFHEIVHNEQPYTFLFSRQELVAIDKRYTNVTIYPLGYDKNEWWVPLGQQRYK